MLFSANDCLVFCSDIPALIIRALLRDSDFDKTMNKAKVDAWIGFMVVANQFLGNKKAPNYEKIVRNKLTLSALKKIWLQNESQLGMLIPVFLANQFSVVENRF